MLCALSRYVQMSPGTGACVELWTFGGLQGEMTMETLIVEIRAAEGGDDAKLLVYEQLGIYQKLALREHL